MTAQTLTGYDAIAYVEEHPEYDGSIHKYADPISPACCVTLDEARDIAREDPSLLYLDPALPPVPEMGRV